MGFPLRDGERHEEVYRGEAIAGKAARRDTDDGVVDSVHDDVVAEDRGAAGVAALPIGVAQHRDRISRWQSIVVGVEEATGGGTRAEHAEVVPRRRDDRQLGQIRAAACRQALRPCRRDAAEGVVERVRGLEHRIRRRGHCVPIAVRRGDLDAEATQGVRIAHSRWCDQHQPRHQADHRRVRSDGEREGRDDA